jgi:hypothetical protein
MRLVILPMTADTLKLVYFAYFHSILCYGLTFWGNLTERREMFTFQQKLIRLLAGIKKRVPCRELFTKLNMLPLASVHLFLFLFSIVDNMARLQTNF